MRPSVLLSTVNCGLSTYFNPGDDRLSHAVARAVPWALEGLTSVFGTETSCSDVSDCTGAVPSVPATARLSRPCFSGLSRAGSPLPSLSWPR